MLVSRPLTTLKSSGGEARQKKVPLATKWISTRRRNSVHYLIYLWIYVRMGWTPERWQEEGFDRKGVP
jgi:hypothetical protein